MARKRITLPVTRRPTDTQPMVLDLLGVKNVEVVRITTDYRDVVKAVVDGDDKDVAELSRRSQEHFEALWPPPNVRDEADLT